jgi:energy-converting hydrogenase Eha subunit G
MGQRLDTFVRRQGQKWQAIVHTARTNGLHKMRGISWLVWNCYLLKKDSVPKKKLLTLKMQTETLYTQLLKCLLTLFYLNQN